MDPLPECVPHRAAQNHEAILGRAIADDALRWMRSLCLPSVHERHWQAALHTTGQWTGTSIGIPLRWLIATKRR
jgi:hypothetical protein